MLTVWISQKTVERFKAFRVTRHPQTHMELEGTEMELYVLLRECLIPWEISTNFLAHFMHA